MKAETPCISITPAKFASLSKHEQEVIRKLGITVKELQHSDPFAGKPIVQSYICLVETTCKLCKSVTITPFSMEGAGTALMSRQIKFFEISQDSKIQTRQERTNVCPSCRSQLSLFSKEELIELSISIMKGLH